MSSVGAGPGEGDPAQTPTVSGGDAGTRDDWPSDPGAVAPTLVGSGAPPPSPPPLPPPPLPPVPGSAVPGRPWRARDHGVRTQRAGETARTVGPARTVVGAVALFLAGLLVALSAAAWWLQREVLDPDRWSATSAAVIADPVVRDDIAALLAERVVAATGIEAQIAAVLPFPLGGLAGALTDRVTDLVARATSAIVGTEAFAGVWERANRLAWAEVLATLRGDGRATDIDDGRLLLDLGPALELVRDELAASGVPGVGSLPLSGIDASFVLVQAPELVQLERLVRFVDVGVIALPIAALVAAAVGLVVWRRWGRALAVLGLGLLVGAGLAGVAADAGRRVGVEAFSGGILGVEAATRVMATVTASARAPVVASVVAGGALVAVGVAIETMAACRRRTVG